MFIKRVYYVRLIFLEVKVIKELRINEEIRVAEVRLVDTEGNSSVMSISDALKHAIEAGLDLVEVSPAAAPPVCRIMDYGKYRFDQLKREKDAKKNQKSAQLKEMKLRPNIEDNDFETKARLTEKFLQSGDKVKITIMFRGREVTHPELGKMLCDKLTERLAEVGAPEKTAKLEGKNMTVIFAPKSSK